MNSMACRVYRNLKFGLLQRLPTSIIPTVDNDSPPIFATRLRSPTQPTPDKSTLGEVIEIAKTVEMSDTEDSHDRIQMEVILSESRKYESARG